MQLTRLLQLVGLRAHPKLHLGPMHAVCIGPGLWQACCKALTDPAVPQTAASKLLPRWPNSATVAGLEGEGKVGGRMGQPHRQVNPGMGRRSL